MPSTKREPQTLAELIEAHRARTGESYADIARAGGGEVTRGFLQRVATSDLSRLPKPETIRAIAKGLGTSEIAVRDAALASLGLVFYGEIDARTESLVAALEDLDDSDLAVVEQVIASLRKRHA